MLLGGVLFLVITTDPCTFLFIDPIILWLPFSVSFPWAVVVYKAIPKRKSNRQAIKQAITDEKRADK